MVVTIRSNFRVPACVILCIFTVPVIPLRSTIGQEKNDAITEQRMKAMVGRVKLLTATNLNGKPIPLIEQPLFRYADPIRATTDGIISGWSHDKQRPKALLALFTEPIDDNTISWSYEFISLSESELQIRSSAPDKNFTWTPKVS